MLSYVYSHTCCRHRCRRNSIHTRPFGKRQHLCGCASVCNMSEICVPSIVCDHKYALTPYTPVSCTTCACNAAPLVSASAAAAAAAATASPFAACASASASVGVHSVSENSLLPTVCGHAWIFTPYTPVSCETCSCNAASFASASAAAAASAATASSLAACASASASVGVQLCVACHKIIHTPTVCDHPYILTPYTPVSCTTWACNAPAAPVATSAALVSASAAAAVAAATAAATASPLAVCASANASVGVQVYVGVRQSYTCYCTRTHVYSHTLHICRLRDFAPAMLKPKVCRASENLIHSAVCNHTYILTPYSPVSCATCACNTAAGAAAATAAPLLAERNSDAARASSSWSEKENKWMSHVTHTESETRREPLRTGKRQKMNESCRTWKNEWVNVVNKNKWMSHVAHRAIETWQEPLRVSSVLTFANFSGRNSLAEIRKQHATTL